MEIFHTLFLQLTEVLSLFNSEIAGLFRELKAENSLGTIFTIFGFATFYGIVHALGPGHGKLLVASYLLTRENSYKKAFKLGYMISGIHAISALSITLIIYFILETTISKSFAEASSITTEISGYLILAVAFYMIYEKFFIKEESGEELLKTDKKDFGIAFAVGVVPCPGVMTITLFSIIVSKVYVGVISAILMSLGMGLTISVAGILATKVKKSSKTNRFNVSEILSNLAILGIFILGIVLISK
jgi:nickel/cobalt exporter